MNENKAQYLSMIQNTIDRMSNISAIFKGFVAAITAGIFTVSFSEIAWYVLLLGMSPMICFAMLDIYYLRLERKFRFLYKNVCNNTIAPNFSMEIAMTKAQYAEAGYRIRDCLKSPCIYLFYIPIAIISIIILILKCNCVI